MNTPSAVIIGASLIAGFAIHGQLTKPIHHPSLDIGRFQVVRSYDNGVILIDTATGRSWSKAVMNASGTSLEWREDSTPAIPEAIPIRDTSTKH